MLSTLDLIFFTIKMIILSYREDSKAFMTDRSSGISPLGIDADIASAYLHS